MSHVSLKKLISYAINERQPHSSIIILKPEHELSSQLKPIISAQIGPSSISVNNRLEPPSIFFPSQFENVADKEEPKKELRNLMWDNDLYEGYVLLNNIHGHGFFSSQKNSQKVFYDGLFYVNKLEGYSQIFYENGTHFQGLFKQHKRYGPGVLTHPNGTQDVGFWNGFSLVRLTIAVESDAVPRLVTTTIGKTKLLCYRYLVPLCNEDDDLARDIFKSVGATDEMLTRSDELLNLTIRNPNSSFFDKNFFDKHFFRRKDCTIKVAVEENDCISHEADNEDMELYNRIRMLRRKILEMDESLEPFLSIKENLLQRIFVCTKCCNVKDSDEITRVHEPSAAESHHTTPGSVRRSDEDAVIDLTSIKPDLSLFDSSLQSFDVRPQASDIEDSSKSKSLSETSTQKIADFCICGEEDEIDDLQQLEDQLANIMKQERFYRNIKDNLQIKLDDIAEREERKQEHLEPKYKLVDVTEVWAWNNGELMMDIQKHCFKHRHSEKMVNFSVPNLILGNRKDFEDAGEHEKLCVKFLLACSNGRKDFVIKCLRENINPNMSDARGNSGVFFAAANCHMEIISILTNFGAKLDHINDEELTPLTLCILKYLSVKNTCDDWEKAFLPETAVCKVPSLPQWHDIQSFLSVSTMSSKQSDCLEGQSSHSDHFNARIVQLFRKLSNMQQKTSSYVANVPNTSYVFNLSYKNSDPLEKQADEQIRGHIQNELKIIHLTIMTLLDYGADPNLANVPYPPLVLSVFTENPDLVLQVLEANANQNVLVTADNLSCLHLISSLKFCEYNIEICRLLALFKCNPNLKTSPTHWEDRKTYFTGNVPVDFDCEDVGKNALQLVCMRNDFDNDPHDYFGSMCKTLINGGADCNETYLGHTPLSLAVLIGNIRLVKYLIKLNVFNPYENLAYGMGNVLTLFTLKRFESTLPTDKCKAMLTALFEVNVNVLYKVGDAENAIDFAESGDVFFKSEPEERKVGKDKSKRAPKPKKTDKRSHYGILKELLTELGRDTIIRQFQMMVTEALYDFIEENSLEDCQIAVAMAEMLTPRIAIDNLEHLFHSEKIDAVRLNYMYVKKLMNFVDLHKKVVKRKKGAPPPATKGKKLKGSASTSLPEGSINDLTNIANFRKSAVHLQREDQFVCKPGLDNSSVYNVCFHCLKGKNKTLKKCPRCQMIKFCSEQCNKLNLKLKTHQHTCNIVFYNMTDEQAQVIANGESLLDLAKTARENCKIRLIKGRELKLYQEELKLLDMWRADTYGTKFLKFKPILAQTARRASQKFTLNVNGLIKLLEKNFRTNPADFDSYSVEALLFKLVNHQKLHDAKECTWDNFAQRFGSRLGSRVGSRMASRHGSVFSEFLVNELLKVDKPPCECCAKKKPVNPPKRKESASVPKKQSFSGIGKPKLAKVQYVADALPTQFEKQHRDVYTNETFTTAATVTKKLKVLPSKYQKFIEIMGMYFPEVDVSTWLLPYACYNNGQLFYKFCDNEMFRESYSLS